MDFVNTIVRCRCGQTMTWCVRISRNVPAPLRCQPRPGGGSSGGSRAVFCPNGHRCFESPDELERAVEALTGSGGWGRWQKAGGVVVEC